MTPAPPRVFCASRVEHREAVEKRTLLAIAPAAATVALTAGILVFAGMIRLRREPGAPVGGEENPQLPAENEPPPPEPEVAAAPFVEEIREALPPPPPFGAREEAVGQVPAERPPRPRVRWELADERRFSGRKQLKSYEPYYIIWAGEPGHHSPAQVLHWRHSPDEPAVEYRPDTEFLLDSSRVMDRRIELSPRTPHTVKWVVEFQAVGGSHAARVEPNGVVIGRAPEGEAFWLTPEAQHTLVIERVGKELLVALDDEGLITKEIKEDDRTPLRITAQIRPAVLRTSRLYFGNGEKMSPTRPKGPKKGEPRWEVAYSEDFSDPRSVEAFDLHPLGCVLEWAPDTNALAVGPRREAGLDQVYVMLKRSLPGDIRVRFRARSTKEGQPPFFGVLVSLKGRLKIEEAYFIEWNYWQVQIKRKNTRVAGKDVGYKKPCWKKEWVSFMAQKLGATITMFTEGREILSWTDPYPLKDSSHDLFAFYSWRVPLELDDLVIERNALDPVRPREDHPVFPENYLDGFRERRAPAAEEERF